MRKGWKQKKVVENIWCLKWTRWYLISPSGNRYHFWRGCYFPVVYVPTTFYALSIEDKDEIKDNEQLARFYKASGKKTKHVSYKSFDGKTYEYDDVVNDMYEQALSYIYAIEDNGGFPEQIRMNAWLESNEEMCRLFSKEVA